MSQQRLYDNIVSVLKEAQLKLGYEEHAIGVNYITRSLCHLLGCGEAEVEGELAAFSQNYADVLGRIEFAARENGFRLTVPVKGVSYVHSILEENEFLSVFIRTVKKPLCTVDDVHSVFYSFSDQVHFERVDNGEFDYLIYFEEEGIDDFWYCLHDDDLQLEYHRFIREDYLDFNF